MPAKRSNSGTDLQTRVEDAFETLPDRYLGAPPGYDVTFHVRLGDVGHTFEVRATSGTVRVRKGISRRPADVVLDLWRALCARWGDHYEAVRVMRECQLLMATSEPSPVPADPRLRKATPEIFDSYFAGAAAMYTEELEEDPLQTNPIGYRSYVRGLIDNGRAFAVVQDGEVVFKADLGAISPRVAQVQGVWVAPEFRGRGMAAGAVVASVALARGVAADVSLYVNDFNTRALRAYRRAGFRQVGRMASIQF